MVLGVAVVEGPAAAAAAERADDRVEVHVVTMKRPVIPVVLPVAHVRSSEAVVVVVATEISIAVLFPS